MARAWLINSRGLANKVKNAARSSAYQIKDCGANRDCPNCHFVIDNSDVLSEWPGLPAGVKFDPSDAELLEHLAAKCGVGNSKPHMFIDEFIPTLDGDNGIYYDHPANLPGSKNDGSSFHFFHKTINAYATGHRKRRKVDCHRSLAAEHVRWHKTGKTKPIMENGVQKGCKKIMVLYKSSKKGSKADKSNWVMHQYHLGTEDGEKEVQGPPTSAPNPPRPGNSVGCDDVPDEDMLHSSAKEAELVPGTQFEDNIGDTTWLAGESQADENCDLDCLEDTLLCKETFDSSTLLNGSFTDRISSTDFPSNIYGVTGNSSTSCGIGDFENIDLGTPPDFQLADLQFCSQDSLLGWLDRL
ncbi:NAC domain-containing protein 8 [Prunus yedoensis var. nudiflora]|uniref:NAC domain-containing protein 8 n=1 Tax=Prunus yedoensis var. nudiflora TaxID=2094558 RepID=A0A314Z4P8_PRUYE|nr:NAC domain-containing protein 8 [Prunus yedoensis var. nudiflora]